MDSIEIDAVLDAARSVGGETRATELVLANLHLLDPVNAERVRRILSDCRRAQMLTDKIAVTCHAPISSELLRLVRAGVDAVNALGIDRLDEVAATSVIAEKQKRLLTARTLQQKLKNFLKQCPQAAAWEFKTLAK